MSYDIAVVLPPIPADDAEAWKVLSQLLDKQGSGPPVLKTFHDQLTARYPCISTLPDDQIDNGIWSDGPLWNSFSQRSAVLGIVYSHVEEALPFVIETAAALNLIVFDWTTNRIHRVEGKKECRLTLENQPILRAPTLQQLHAAIDRLTPRGGPGFLILESEGQDYVQAAGGDGCYTVEWRGYAGQKFQHWVAGLPGLPSEKEIAIPTNGCIVTVKENERLGAADVKTILTSFAERNERPIEFAWRNITERFA